MGNDLKYCSNKDFFKLLLLSLSLRHLIVFHGLKDVTVFTIYFINLLTHKTAYTIVNCLKYYFFVEHFLCSFYKNMCTLNFYKYVQCFMFIIIFTTALLHKNLNQNYKTN